MKIALIGPGIMSIPPDGWGAVEDLIWELANELGELGHTGVIINMPNTNEILSEVFSEKFDFIHLFYDVFYPIMDIIKERSNRSITAISSAYPYVDQMEYHRKDGYNGFFNWATTQRDHYNFCLSDKDLDAFKSNGADPDKLLRLGLGAQHKKFAFNMICEFEQKTLYIAKIESRKRQWIYQSIPNIDFVGKYTPTTTFNKMNKNYLGEWTPEEKYSNFTKYANLLLLSDGENGTPLVVKEALISGLGVVVSKYAAYDLDESLPFITIIDENNWNNLEYVQNEVIKNRNISRTMRNDIKDYGIKNFSWEVLTKKYIDSVESLL